MRNGVTKNDFINDTEAMKSVLMDKYSIRPHGYVYPRNQVIYTDVLMNCGYKLGGQIKNFGIIMQIQMKQVYHYLVQNHCEC